MATSKTTKQHSAYKTHRTRRGDSKEQTQRDHNDRRWTGLSETIAEHPGGEVSPSAGGSNDHPLLSIPLLGRSPDVIDIATA